jgi:NADPH:quinone reductase-like Zn-dependent oxidoreductase
MKAIVYRTYGSPDVLRCEELEKPTPKDNEVLIKVCAASVNPLDSHLMRGKPYVARLIFGLRRPRIMRPGVDVAGRVEAVGRNVTSFKPGDEVFGSCRGAFAEYACASETKLVMKPGKVTFEQAAAAPVAALTALQGLRDKGKLQPSQKLLVHGAAGGCGTFAVQIGKWLGAEVTAVCSTRNVEMVRSIGADRVIDYAREDFIESPQRYDVIFDLVGNHSLSAYRRVLSPKGIYVGAGALGVPIGSTPSLLVDLLKMLALSALGRNQKLIPFLARIRREDLTTIGELMAAGKVTAIIERCYSLNETPEAIRHVAGAHARGKVVIRLRNKEDA